MSRILLTGGTGLIGSHLLRAIAPRHDVWAIVRRDPPEPHPGVHWVRQDLADPELSGALPDRIDAVIHLAQSPRFREFPEAARHIFEVNVGSTARLLDWAHRAGAGLFLHASSGGIYGHGERDFREDELRPSPGPLGYYLASKQCGELLVENYASHLTVGILRFFFVYGPGQRESMLIPRLIRSVAEGRPVKLQGDNGLRINPVHVDDAVKAIAAGMELGESAKINVAGPEALTLREVAERIGEAVGRDPVFEIDLDQSPAHLVGDIDRMRSLLVPPRIRFADAIGTLCSQIVPA